MSTDIFDSFDDTQEEDDESKPPGTALVAPIKLRPMAWGSLIMEMMLDPANGDEILAAHGTTAQEVNDLMLNNDEFRTAIRECQSRVKAHGASSGFVLRNQMIAEELLPEMYRMAVDKNSPPAVKLRAIENAVSWGRLDPKLDKDRRAETDTGVHVSINMIGLKDMPQIVSVEQTREDQ